MTTDTKKIGLLGLGAVMLAGCQTGTPLIGNHVPADYYEGTALTRHEIDVRSYNETVEISLVPANGDMHPGELSALNRFIQAYEQFGHGPLFVKVPASGAPLTDRGLYAVQTMAWKAGVHEGDLQLAQYNAGQDNGPMLLSFKAYEAARPDCSTMGAFDMAKTNNNDLPSLGCAVRTNMAAIISDPHDLFGSRRFETPDSGRTLTQMGLWREGQDTSAQRDSAPSVN